jgi:hypothetical protein
MEKERCKTRTCRRDRVKCHQTVLAYLARFLPTRLRALRIAPIFSALSRVLHSAVLLFFLRVLADRVARHLHIYQG